MGQSRGSPINGNSLGGGGLGGGSMMGGQRQLTPSLYGGYQQPQGQSFGGMQGPKIVPPGSSPSFQQMLAGYQQNFRTDHAKNFGMLNPGMAAPTDNRYFPWMLQGLQAPPPAPVAADPAAAGIASLPNANPIASYGPYGGGYAADFSPGVDGGFLGAGDNGAGGGEGGPGIGEGGVGAGVGSPGLGLGGLF